MGRLGRGGFADVYLARPDDAFRLVALKVLRANVDERVREQVVSRFHTEESIARAVDHPAVVEVLATSAPGVEPAYIAMEYVDGQSFCDYLRTRSEPLDLHLVARLGGQVARAMAAAHAKGIVHRDLKPENVLVTTAATGGPSARILDFGIAKAPLGLFARAPDRAVTRYVTELGTVMGSPPYMAPEQNGAAHAVTGKADVFALGMMLLVVVCHLDEDALYEAKFVIPDPDVLRELLSSRPRLPASWAGLLEEMLAFDPQQRPSMDVVARRLQRLAQSNVEFAHAVEAWIERRVVPSPRRLRALLEWAGDGVDLTPDELRFLRQAPAARLPRRRGAKILAWVMVPLLAAAGAAAATEMRRTAMASPVVSASPAPVAQLPSASAVVARPPSSALPVCESVTSDRPSAAAAAVEIRRQLDACRRAERTERAKAEQLRAKLESTASAVADLEVDVAEERHRVEGLQRELERSRETAAEEGKKAFACSQQLESRGRQLEESMQRWRLCAKGRGGVGPAPASESGAASDGEVTSGVGSSEPSES